MEKVKMKRSLLTHWLLCVPSASSTTFMPELVSLSPTVACFCFLDTNFWNFIAVLVTFMKAGADKTSSVHYASSALTYLLAMVCSNLALQWVGYPTQVISKYFLSYNHIYHYQSNRW